MKIKFILLSILSGLLFAASWPAIGNATYLIFLAMLPLLFVEALISKKLDLFRTDIRILLYSYIAFFVFNLLASWWIYKASLWGAGMAIIFNSLFMAIVFWLFHICKRKVGSREGYLGLIIFWLAFEYLHLNWDLSWPWFTFGNVFANTHSWVQWYEYTGILGGSLWVLLLNILIFQLAWTLYLTKKSLKPKLIFAFSAILFLILPILLSLNMYGRYAEKGKDVEIVVVQPNIDPYYDKFWGMAESDQIDRLVSLAREKTSKNTQFVVMPETAFPMAYWEHELEYIYGTEAVRKLIADFPQLRVIVGLTTSKLYIQGDKLTSTARPFSDGKGHYDNYNAAIQIDSSNNIPIHHKSKLVLGVEKIPFTKYLPFMKRLSIDLGGSSGSLGYDEQPAVFGTEKPGDIKVAPIICYESIYGEYVNQYANQDADLYFIITNDGWWGNTPGYQQHLAYAKLRAIESRRSIARSANTGISAFINQRGDILQQTEWWVQASMIQSLKANPETTFYIEYGDYIGRTAAFIALLLLLLILVKKLNKTEQRLKGIK